MGTSVPGPSNPVKGVYVTLHETDVDKVRKIKKIIKAIKKGEELSQGLLDKIKSQGVSEMDDSAMIMRVKFVCVPGEQFVLRREVYRRIQEAFRKNGIEFAYRNVTVYFPPESTSGSDPQPSENMTEPEPQDQKKERGCCSCNNESHLRKKIAFGTVLSSFCYLKNSAPGRSSPLCRLPSQRVCYWETEACQYSGEVMVQQGKSNHLKVYTPLNFFLEYLVRADAIKGFDAFTLRLTPMRNARNLSGTVSGIPNSSRKIPSSLLISHSLLT